jgi:two-component system, cell cycle sensor histidine kinase and response regulator CckA
VERSEDFEALARVAPVGLFVADDTGTCTYVNPRFTALTGLTAAEARAGGWHGTVHPEDRAWVVAAWDAARRAAAPFAQEVRLQPPGGSTTWVLAQAEAERDARGVVASFVGSLTDLTESEAKHRHLFTNTPAIMHSIDREGRLVSVSNAWLAAMGYERDEVIGRRSTEFLTARSQRHAVDVVLPSFFATGVCTDVPYEFVRKDGDVIDVLLSATCERDPDGKIVRSLAVLVDVTEKKRTEEALRQAQKMEALGRLAGGVAHDFNNLLTAVLGYAELALRDRPSQEALLGIRQAVDHGSALTRQLLAFSRRQLLELRALDLNDVVKGVTAMLGRLLGEDVQLVLRLTPSPARVRADRSQLEQVIVNLVVNARDAMPRGGPVVLETGDVVIPGVEAQRLGLRRAGEYVTLVVRDTGVGMDPPTLARVFEPFFTTKPAGKGTGLGLSTVYGICEQTGGHVRVESEPGLGATFTVFLPREALDRGA